MEEQGPRTVAAVDLDVATVGEALTACRQLVLTVDGWQIPSMPNVKPTVELMHKNKKILETMCSLAILNGDQIVVIGPSVGVRAYRLVGGVFVEIKLFEAA